jgi:hypothetical protein
VCAFANDGEENWWSQVKPLLAVYGLPEELDIIKNLSKEAFKKMVNKGVEHVLTQQLKSECSKLKKTSHLVYEDLQTQHYLKSMFPSQAKLILQSRSQTLDIKTHNGYKFEDGDFVCRKCDKELEVLEHIVNCGHVQHVVPDVLEIHEETDLMLVQLTRTANRIQQFYDDVEQLDASANNDTVSQNSEVDPSI